MEMANDKMGGIDIMYYVAGQAMHVKFEEITVCYDLLSCC